MYLNLQKNVRLNENTNMFHVTQTNLREPLQWGHPLPKEVQYSIHANAKHVLMLFH